MNSIEKYLDKVFEGDCLQIMNDLPENSIDMVLCDLPYGVTHNNWDQHIDLTALWKQYKRLLKPGGVAVLTGQGIFTAQLILSNKEWFRYKIVWIKSKATNFLNAKKQPLRKHEDICVFYNRVSVYHPQMAKGVPYDRGIRSGLTENYNYFKPAHTRSISGDRYPFDIVFYEEGYSEDYVYFKTSESEGPVWHSTQKPVALGRYLVRTYSNPGAVILDNACGSGSFLVSAMLEGRHFIGIEKNDYRLKIKTGTIDLIQVCEQRIRSAINEM